MNFVWYMWSMAFGTFLAWGGWSAVLLNVNPDEGGFIAFLLFYLTLLVSLIGTFTLLGIVIRVYVKKRTHVIIREVHIAFRHAVFLGTMAVVSLGLSAHGWLKWWVFLLLLAAIALLEYVALIIQEGRRA